MPRTAPTLLVALALAALAALGVAPALGDAVRWTPDGLFYQARVLQLHGAPERTRLWAMVETPEAVLAVGEIGSA